jgi:GT2 family glycosyltransferase
LASESNHPTFGAIVIGRNEGDRLKRCLLSLSNAHTVVYVDSGSTDGSPQWARDRGVDVVDLDTTVPFTAARARNSGLKRILSLAPNTNYVQFIDGDCELIAEWAEAALLFLEQAPQYCAVFGRLKERHPERSIYNRLCDMEWNAPLGESRSCGGVVMMRTSSFLRVGGFREDLIAGEEPELCVRLRAHGFKIWRIDNDMAWHDAAILSFGQWWRRNVRSGFAFAQGAHLHRSSPDHHWVWESQRALIWGLAIPLACLLLSIFFGKTGLASWIIYPLQIIRLSIRGSGSFADRIAQATFQTLGRFPETEGQLKFFADTALGRRRGLIEHK